MNTELKDGQLSNILTYHFLVVSLLLLAPILSTYAGSSCHEIASQFLNAQADSRSQLHIIDQNEYNNNPELHKRVWRGLVAVHTSYHKQQVLIDKRSLWDLHLSISSTINEAAEVRFLTIQSEKEIAIKEILNSFVIDGEQGARGTGHPLARTLALVSHFGIESFDTNKAAQEVLANAFIYKTTDDITTIGRLYLAKELPPSQRIEFYRQILETLTEINTDTIIIEAGDLSHLKLYQKMGFTIKEEVPLAYGQQKIYVLESTRERFARFLSQLK